MRILTMISDHRTRCTILSYNNTKRLLMTNCWEDEKFFVGSAASHGWIDEELRLKKNTMFSLVSSK